MTWAPMNMPLSLIEVAQECGVSKHTARAWSSRGEMPEPDAIVAGHIPVWRKATIQAWFNKRTRARGERSI